MEQPLTSALKTLSVGKIALLLDDAIPIPRGYLIFSASRSTPENVCFFVNHGRGLVFAALSEQRVRELGLPMMSSRAGNAMLDLTVSVEARLGVTTGISASDRSITLKTLATTDSPRMELVTPGHIFPWRARAGGVLVRTTAAEAAVDLLELGGEKPVAAVCECLDVSGKALTPEGLEALAREFSLPVVRLSEIVRHRISSESIVEQVAHTALPIRDVGMFRAYTFRSRTDQAEHLALAVGIDTVGSAGGISAEELANEPILVRVQAEQGLPELFGFSGSRKSIFKALQRIHDAGRGIFVFVRHPRKGLIESQVRFLAANTERQYTPVAVLREFGVGAQILKSLGARRIVLLGGTKNIAGLDAFQLEIVDQKPL